MSSYSIGSVADFISQDKGIKKLAKKNKVFKSKENSQLNKADEIKLSESKEVIEESPKKTKVKGNSLDKINESKPEKVKSPLKRKSGSNSANESVKLKKPKKDLLDLDQIPSDSSENESSSEKPIIKPGEETRPQKKYTDFTENTIFVGNLPLTFDKDKVRKVFSKFGKIKSARIRCVPIADINMSKKVAAVKKKYNPQRNSLLAYVKYETEDAAKAALEANGMVIEGHHLRVDLAEEKKERDLKKAVFVGGLPFNIEDDELWEFFKDCGKIVSVRVVRDSQTSMGKGFGYVNFDSTASVELALQLDGQELKKRKINVKRCRNEKSKNKFKSFDKRKSKEMVDQLRAKKKQKNEGQKKKAKKEDKSYPNVFQGNTANMKHRKKKKLSQVAKRRRKVMKILGSS